MLVVDPDLACWSLLLRRDSLINQLLLVKLKLVLVMLDLLGGGVGQSRNGEDLDRYNVLVLMSPWLHHDCILLADSLVLELVIITHG